MTNGIAFLLGALAVTMPSILWFSILIWNAPELCDELRVDVRENDASDNVIQMHPRSGSLQ
jgi:hypothetical protein